MKNLVGYTVTETLFQSASTRVFRAKQDVSGKSVILRTCAEQGASAYEYARLSFTREVLDIFTHVNISGLLDWVDDPKFPILVTEDIQGQDLRSFSKSFDKRQFPLDIFLNLASQLAEALSVVHHEQVIHKDLHPGNIVVNPNTLHLQMIDFGLASLLTREQPAIEAPENLEGVLGYISPEQTGRMNRALDYRTDFYTLGVTLYEMLAGCLPFEADDALGMVYAHMAVQQKSVYELRSDVPEVVSEIIDKLMSKNAEDRYQSALGLKLDLERCRTELNDTGSVTAFDIATQDISDRFRIPQTLYGRQDEIKALLAHYEQVTNGQAFLLAVGGYSGVGKSALIHEIHKPIAANNGLFLKGKFDQFQQNTPYSGFKTALMAWVDQVLRLPDNKLSALRDVLNERLTPNAGVLTEFMPELEAVLGKQAKSQVLAPQETLARFNIVLLSFIKAVTAEQPWVVFIDDIQWADAGTLNLIPELVREPDCRILVIVAFRDNEISELHPAQRMLNTAADIQREHPVYSEIKLKPLPQSEIQNLLADALHRPVTDVDPLAQLVMAKTAGNPFFTVEFLKMLYSKGLLDFDLAKQHWLWDIDAIDQQSITDNVVELMLERLSKLPKETQELMQRAACVGSRFDLGTLAVISNQTLADTAELLWPALREGLLIQEGGDWFLGSIGGEQLDLSDCTKQLVVKPDGNTVRPFDHSGSLPAFSNGVSRRLNTKRTGSSSHRALMPRCKFLHDRMLQAAYESLSEGTRALTHLSIGRLLLKNMSEQQQLNAVFDLVEQFNYGVGLVDDLTEREQLAALNSVAAQRAKASSVWVAAAKYAETALAFMSDSPWDDNYQCSYELHCVIAESKYLSGNYDLASKLYSDIFEHTQDALDKVELLVQRLIQDIGRADYAGSLVLGRQGLDIFGIEIPSERGALDRYLSNQHERLTKAFEQMPVSKFHQLPECKERSVHLRMNLLINYGLVCMLSNDSKSMAACIKESVLLCIQHGRSEFTVPALSSLGLILLGQGKLSAAFNASEKAEELLRYYPNSRNEAIFWNSVGLSFKHLKAPAIECCNAYMKGFEVGLRRGELSRAGVCLSAKVVMASCTGQPLKAVLEDQNVADAFSEQKDLRVGFSAIWRKSIESHLAHSNLLADEHFSQEVLDRINNTVFYGSLLALRFDYNFWDEADSATQMSSLRLAVDSSDMMKTHFMTMDLYCLGCLVILRARAEGYFLARKDELSTWQSYYDNFKHVLQTRTDLYEPNTGHKLALVEATEMVLEQAPFDQILKKFQLAVRGAEDNGFRQYAGLANEYYGQFLVDHGFEDLARRPIEKALFWYNEWQSKIKVDILTEKFTFLSQQASSSLEAHSVHSVSLASATRSASAAKAPSLDVLSIMKSTQAISSELALQSLLENVMRIIMENAGAQRAGLVYLDNGLPMLEAYVDQTQHLAEYLSHKPLAETDCLPISTLSYTLRTQKAVNISNATSASEFSEQAYSARFSPKSILCLPMMYRDACIGALYLENNMSVSAFTSSSLDLVQILLTQASISIENARLFTEVTTLNEGLEEKVRTRTQELDSVVSQLTKANKELESFSYTVSHDLRSPLRSLKGYTDILREDNVDKFDPESMFLLNRISSSAEKMSDLINGLLDLSRVQRQEIERHDCDLSEMAEKVIQDLLDNDPTRQVSVDIQDSMLCSGDERMLSSVLENLLGNAWKYSSKRPLAEITFTSEELEGKLVYCIKDNGAGFDMEYSNKLFATFQRLHHEKEFSGTGVGLATVKRVIEKHGGEIWAESELGKGASFYFTLA